MAFVGDKWEQSEMLKLLDAFPLLLLMIAAYGLFVLTTGSAEVGTALNAELININTTSGDQLMFTTGDLFILISFVILFIEVIKSTSTGTVSIMNHGLSAAVMVLAVVLLLIAQGFGSTTFLFITLMTMFDVIAGFIITTITARRDIGFGGGVG